MGDAACGADSDGIEEMSLFKENHDDGAEDAACEGEPEAHDAAKEKGCNEDPDKVNEEGTFIAEGVEGDNNDDVGKAELHSGNGKESRDLKLHIAEDQGNCCHNTV